MQQVQKWIFLYIDDIQMRWLRPFYRILPFHTTGTGLTGGINGDKKQTKRLETAKTGHFIARWTGIRYRMIQEAILQKVPFHRAAGQSALQKSHRRGLWRPLSATAAWRRGLSIGHIGNPLSAAAGPMAFVCLAEWLQKPRAARGTDARSTCRVCKLHVPRERAAHATPRRKRLHRPHVRPR